MNVFRAHHRIARRRFGALQTPVHRWRRDDQAISLVGMVHVAERDFYSRVQRFADDAAGQGAVVHYERVKPHDPAAVLTGCERKLLPPPGEAPQPWMRTLARTMGLTYQLDGLTVRPEWQNIDVDRLTAIRSMGPKAARRLFEQPDFIDDLTELSPDWQRRFGDALRFTVRGLPMLRLMPVSLTLGRPATRMVEDWRNVLAATAALDAVAQQPVVMLWGAAHLAGMGDIFEANGFELQRPVIWLDAVHRKRVPA